MLEGTTLNLADDYFLDVYEDNLTNGEKAAAAVDFLREFARAVLRDEVEDLSAFEPFTVDLLAEFLNNFNALCARGADGKRDLSNLKTLGHKSKEEYLISTIRQRYQSFDEAETPVIASSLTVSTAIADVLTATTVVEVSEPVVEEAPVEEIKNEPAVQESDDTDRKAEEVPEELVSLDPLQKLKVLMAKIERAIEEYGPRKSRGFASKILVASNALIGDTQLSMQAKQALAILVEPICDHGSITVNDRRETSFALASGLKDVDFRAVLDRFLSVLFPDGGAGELTEKDLLSLRQMGVLVSNFATSNVWSSEEDSIRYEVQMGKAVKELMKTLANPKQNAAFSLDQVKAIQALADFLLKNLYTYRDKSSGLVTLRTNAALHKKPTYLQDTLREVVVPPVTSDVLTTITTMSARLRALLDERENNIELARLREELSSTAPEFERLEASKLILASDITALEEIFANWTDEIEQAAAAYESNLAEIKKVDDEVKALGRQLEASGEEVGVEVITKLGAKLSEITQIKARNELLAAALVEKREELDKTERLKNEKVSEMNSFDVKLAQLTLRRTSLLQQISVIERGRAAKEANIRAVRTRLTALVVEVDASLASARELLTQ